MAHLIWEFCILLLSYDQLNELDDPLPFYAQFAIATEVLTRQGLVPHQADVPLFHALRTEAKRLEGRSVVVPFEAAEKPAAQRQDHFNRVVAWVKGQLAPDGKIFDRQRQKTLKGSQAIAYYLSVQNPMVGPEHVAMAQRELRAA